jgi:hypothetical protein
MMVFLLELRGTFCRCSVRLVFEYAQETRLKQCIACDQEASNSARDTYTHPPLCRHGRCSCCATHGSFGCSLARALPISFCDTAGCLRCVSASIQNCCKIRTQTTTQVTTTTTTHTRTIVAADCPCVCWQQQPCVTPASVCV